MPNPLFEGWADWFPVVADNWPQQWADECRHVMFEAQRARGNRPKRKTTRLQADIIFALRPFLKISVGSRGKR